MSVATMPTISTSGKQSIDAVHWLGWADQDYLAARALLLGGLVVQGSSLACTAIEKYLKGVCTISSIPFQNVSHDVSKLNGLLYNRGIVLKIDSEFLRFLNKAYKLRYPDELSPGFNIALNSIATLVETDISVQVIRNGFTFKQQDGKEIKTKFDEMIKSRSAELLTKNCAIGSNKRPQLFAEPSFSYDLRVLPDGTIMEASYVVESLLDDTNFQKKGLAPVEGSDGKSFNLAWPPRPAKAE